jgi:hypothetical protein
MDFVQTKCKQIKCKSNCKIYQITRAEKATVQQIGHLLWSRKLPRKLFSLSMSWNWNIFMGTNTFDHAEFKSENFPHRRPAVFSQTATLSSQISQQIFSLFNDTDGWRHTIA